MGSGMMVDKKMTIKPKSPTALLQAVRIARENKHAQFRVPGQFPMTAADVLRMWERGVMARCNRGLAIAPDNMDLAIDARTVNDYMRGIRHSGCRGLLRTAKMRARYPHIHNQPWEK